MTDEQTILNQSPALQPVSRVREKALSWAVASSNGGGYKLILDAAKAFEDYLLGGYED